MQPTSLGEIIKLIRVPWWPKHASGLREQFTSGSIVGACHVLITPVRQLMHRKLLRPQVVALPPPKFLKSANQK